MSAPPYWVVLCIFGFSIAGLASAAELQIGVAKTDITPSTPIRLTGYAARKTESEGVEQRLYARGLAIGTSKADAVVLVTLDTMAVPHEVTDEVAGRLRAKADLPRERVAFCATHTHAAPCLTNAAPNIFGQPIAADQQGRIDAYTKELTDKLEQTALAALADLKPGTLAIARGSVGFAANRRKPLAPGVPGPVDQELPVLVARGADGAIRAVVANYACHCTTGGSDINKVHGDWAGCASEDLEAANSGAVALITIGCGADANPAPRGNLQLARQHGAAVASEVSRLVKDQEHLKPLTNVPAAQFKVIELAYDKLPTKEELEKLSEEKTAPGANARIQLDRLARDGKLSPTIPYRLQTWTFDDDLCMVFLSGEVVVDYALRLKHDFDPKRLWVSSYSNDVLCYIPSRRILAEGGYEAEGAMVYYARPTRFAPSVENDIIRAAHSIIPASFRSEASLKEFPLPKPPEQSRQSIKVDGDLKVELVAAEPLVQSPVAIDWDLRGRLWVLEMYDYPSGLNDNNMPGGRVVILESSRHDGHYDKRTVFLDHLPYPQGLMCWRSGVLVCAAPDILYAADEDRDDRPDSVKVLFSGFSPDNQQWEVNGLTWGLDNWVYGASSIHNDPIKAGETDRTIDLGGRDFRMNPQTLAFEPAAGRTQFCRVRDDFGNWFGNDNSNPLWHYPLEERYVRRNPHVSYPGPRVPVVADKDPTKLFPISRLLERFNNPESANRVTSGCGPTVYRDRLLFQAQDSGLSTQDLNAFFCEPVHNLVRRLILTPRGATFSARRSPQDEREFLASSDNWFRPVQTRTGPDGALWVVDMYRFVIEHPRWITKERLATLDTRAGAEMGRIYRVVPKEGGLRTIKDLSRLIYPATPTESPLRPIEDLSRLTAAQLAERMDSDNGVVRDLIHRELVDRDDRSAVPVLEGLTDAANPAVRVQAACALDGLRGLKLAILNSQIYDSDPRVRRNGLRLAERLIGKDVTVADAALALAKDADLAVRYQLALTLGECDDARAPAALARIVKAAPEDAWTRAAVLSAAGRRPFAVLEAIPASDGFRAIRSALAALVARTGDKTQISEMARECVGPMQGGGSAVDFALVADILDALEQRRLSPASLDAPAVSRLAEWVKGAALVPEDEAKPLSVRLAAMRLLGRSELDGAGMSESDLSTADMLLDPRQPPALQSAALAVLVRSKDGRAAERMIGAIPRVSPALRGQLFDALTSRPTGVEALLAAVDGRRISPTDLPAAVREKLLAHPDAGLREHAAKSLAPVRPAARVEALKTFGPALKLTGDAAKGKAIFEKSCAACHQLGGVGHPVGPDLSALTDKSANYLLVAIVDPNAAVEGRFVAYQLQTLDDETYVGLLADENASALTILQPNGMRQAVARSQIKSLSSSTLSLMPEGLEQGMSAQDLADLIGFIQQTR